MSTILNMVEGDTAPDRTFTITRSGVVVDLTNASHVKMILSDSSTGAITNTNHYECTIDNDPTTGKATYAFQTGDIASGNVHLGDIQIDWNSSQIETDFDQIVIYVRPKQGTVS